MTQIISQLGSADPASSFGSNTLPDFDNIMGEWWLGGSAANNVNAITGVLATPGGTAVYAPASVYLENSANGSLLLDVGPGASDFSMLALVRNNAAPANNALIAASPSDGGGNYNLGFADSNTISAGNGQFLGSTDQANLDPPDSAKFTLVMGVYRLNQPGRIFMRTTAGGTTTDDGGAQFAPSARELGNTRLGGSFNANFGGGFDLAAFAIVSEARGASYIEELYPLWKAYAESRGLTVN